MVCAEGEADTLKSTTRTRIFDDVLGLKLALPAYVAVIVRGPSVEKVRVHSVGLASSGDALVQLSPVLAWTVTLPVGERAPSVDTTNETIVEPPTNTGFGTADTIVVDVLALAPLPWSGTCCSAPLMPPLSSAKVSVPVSGPTEKGAKATVSEQLPPGAIGDAARQLCVDVNGPVTPTPATCSGADPGLVRVTVCGALVVPTG